MIPRKSDSSKRTPVPRLTTSNPDHSFDYAEELLYTSNLPDTTSDLKRPRAASGSALLDDELEASSKTTQQHIYGQPCPDHDANCHYHHQLTQYCHIPWRHCCSALNAIKQSYRAGGEWIGAPEGWNEAHRSCLKIDEKKCNIHAQLQETALEKQRNKKYPEKLRTRGRGNRGSGNQKKGLDDAQRELLDEL